MTSPIKSRPKLHGVDHTARPTWKLRETVHFYRDLLGLELVHCISAKGWGREKEEHADFLHFFFDSGNESTIAFFYYIGTDQPGDLVVPKGYMAMANHTAWRVKSEEELLRFRTVAHFKPISPTQSWGIPSTIWCLSRRENRDVDTTAILFNLLRSAGRDA